MENQEFDNALRDYIKRSNLPYEPSQWDRMTQRLEAYDDEQKPATKRRVIPFYRWATGAVAACVIVMAAWYFRREQSATDSNDQKVAAQTQMPPVANTADTVLQQPTESKTGIAAIPAGPAYPAENRRNDLPGKPALTVSPEITRPPVPVANSDSSAPAYTTTIPDKPERPVAHDQPARIPVFNNPVEPDNDLPAGRKLAFGVNGGYNIGNAKNNFTVGVTVRRNLSDRLNLETGVALVSGAYETHREVVPEPGHMIGQAKAYEAVSNQLLYLQAAPTLSYRIYRGLSAGGGVDAQRLLGNSAKTATLDGLGRESATQPQWDFGLTGRIDLQVVKKLRAGMMYRESIGAISKEGSAETARRNYLLLQLSYTLF